MEELDPAARLSRRRPRLAGRGKLDFTGHGELNAAGHGELDPAARLTHRWWCLAVLRVGRGKLNFTGHEELDLADVGACHEQGDRQSNETLGPTTTSVFLFASRPRETQLCLSLRWGRKMAARYKNMWSEVMEAHVMDLGASHSSTLEKLYTWK
nr:unnamed protein product [Digitaria exilis]